MGFLIRWGRTTSPDRASLGLQSATKGQESDACAATMQSPPRIDGYFDKKDSKVEKSWVIARANCVHALP